MDTTWALYGFPGGLHIDKSRNDIELYPWRESLTH